MPSSDPALESTAAALAPVSWGDDVWQLQLDRATGAITQITNKRDPHGMNWVRQSGRWEHRDWVADTSAAALPLGGQWGLVSTAHTGLLHVANVRRVSERAWEAVYVSAVLTVTVRRELDPTGALIESYTFKHTGVVDLELPVGAVSISAPFFDQYPDASESLTNRCHTHLWTGGASSWVNALRMGTAAPHLGLVLTQGSLVAYSQHGSTFNDRGVFLLHPAAMRLKRNDTVTIAWRLFWHKGWEDFFAKVAGVEGFVRMTAKDYVMEAGQPLEIVAESSSALAGAQLLVNGSPISTQAAGSRITASIPTSRPGDLLVAVDLGGRQSWLRAYVTPAVDALIDGRVKFIVRRQQRHAPGDPLDGAYLAFDNETGQQVYNPARSDHNAGRERVAMGVLGALYLPRCRDEAFKVELRRSLERYSAFVSRELEDEQGVVYERVGREKHERIYNFPWVAHFHLAMYRATGDADQLERFGRVMRAYYATEKGSQFYPIGIPAYEGLKALSEAGRAADREELLGKLRAHADYFLKTGTNYPRSEVNFEQSIVAPAVQLLAEMYVITGEPRYLEGAKAQMPLLEAFAGRQPDHRLNEISIRHWDDYWFGKLRVYGDTMPHYWSTINALAYAYYGIGTNDPNWNRRAEDVVKGNLSLFSPEGTGSAAYLNALTTNGTPGQRNDPWANDQDWALVNLLRVRELNAAR